ncbi:hypothetical protein X975_11133, partial [Stegodyphus mimosarum]
MRKRSGSAKMCIPENVARVEEVFSRSPRHSAHKHALQLDILECSVWQTFHKELQYKPYKMQIVQKLNVNNLQRDYAFARKCWNSRMTAQACAAI